MSRTTHQILTEFYNLWIDGHGPRREGDLEGIDAPHVWVINGDIDLDVVDTVYEFGRTYPDCDYVRTENFTVYGPTLFWQEMDKKYFPQRSNTDRVADESLVNRLRDAAVNG